MAILPEDLLVAILGRLPSRSLMASRCVCKAWRDLVDGDRRLRRLLLPHYVRGLFINYQDYGRPHFFARPPASAADPRISGEFDFVPRKKRYGYYSSWYEVLDHCNGLVLFLETSGDLTYVCNPTTRRWTRLPPPPPCSGETGWWGRRVFLVFDPAVSPHYKVLLAPMEPTSEKSGVDRLMEWPPSPWTWQEFSSETGRWETKVFVREGEAAGTVGDLLFASLEYNGVQPRWRYAAYWQEEIYMHCHGEYVSR